MATVTNTIKLPGGITPTSAAVEIELVASTTTKAAGWVTATDVTILATYRPTVTAGAWSADLTPNADITPSGTVYRINEYANGKRYTHYIEVVSGGGTVHDLLTDEPGSVESAALTVHKNLGTGAHAASAITVTDAAGYYAAATVETALAEIGARQVVLPAATGTDLSTINGFLATFAGGVVKGRPGESYTVSGPILVPSDTTLDMAGCEVTLAAGSNTNLLRNSGTAATATGTGSINSGSTTLTTALTLSAGQTVSVAGAGNSAGGPLIADVVSTGPGTATLSKAAGATVSSAATNVYNRDSNIVVRGGTWHRGSNSGGGTGLHSLLFRHVDGLDVQIDGLTSAAGKYAISIADATDVTVAARGLDAYSDGVHIAGPVTNLRVPYVIGRTIDDTFAITGSDWTSYNDSCGDVVGVHIGLISGDADANLCKLIAGAGNRVDDVYIDHVRGVTQDLNGVWIGDDSAQANTTGGTYGSIRIGMISAACGNGGAQLQLFSPAAGLVSARCAVPATLGLDACVRIGGSSTATIDLLEVQIDAPVSGASPDIDAGVYVDSASTTIRNLLLRDSVFKSGTKSAVQVRFGTVRTLELRNVLGVYTGKTVSHVLIQSNAVVPAITFVGGRVEAANHLLRTDPTTDFRVVLDRIDMYDMSRVADVRGVGTVTFVLQGPHLDTCANSPFFTNGKSLVFTGHWGRESYSPASLQRNASEVCRSLSPMLRFGVEKLAKSNVGDMANNVNGALSCGLGIVICDGTNWVNATTGATY